MARMKRNEHSYNESIILGKEDIFLEENQKKYLLFEEESFKKKYIEYLNQAQCESDMHYLFETNPILLPGLYDLHNGPVGDIVISKLQLSHEYVTDFAFISVNSATAQITMIEIESPKMKIFRGADDLFSSDFNRALQQTRDWTLWAHQNQTYLKDLFRETYHRGIFRYQQVVTKTVLIAGRRKEIQMSPQREKRWAAINQEVEPSVVLSYDRLAEYLSYSFNTRLLQKLICRPRRYISTTLRSRT